MAYNRTLQHFISGQEVATLWSGPGSNYLLNQLVIESQKLYLCLVSHTSSSSFLTDLASGKWEEVSASEAGVFNYIGNGSAEVDTTGWSTYADAAGTQPVDGTGGSPSIAWTRSETSPLRGVADFNLTKDAANRQGQGVSYDFTIDPADKAKVLSVTFDYEVLSGTYADGDLTVYLIADPTGTPVVIQPAGYTVQSATVGTTMRQIATFQTQASGTSYRLCLHVASTSASAYTLAVDNVVVGPQTVVYGSPVTDWVSYTPTLGGITLGTGTQRFFWRRVGDSIEIKGNILFTASTSVTGKFTFTLPAGFSIDSTKNPYPGAVNGFSRLGVASVYDTTQRSILSIVQDSTSSNTFYLNGKDGTTSITQVDNTSFTWGSADEIEIIELTVPISGWSSSVEMSNNTDTRVVVADAYVSTNTTAAPNNSAVDLIVNAVNTDTHGTVNTITGTITIPVSGYYNLNGRVGIFGANVLASRYNAQIRDSANTILVDGTAITPTAGTVNGLVASGTSIFLTAGTVIKLSLFGAGNNSSSQVGISGAGPATTRLSASRVSGPATIAASESVQAKYWAGANGASNTSSPVNFSSKVYDSHGSVTTGAAWKFTAPISGKYLVACFLNNSAANINTNIALYRNGVFLEVFGYIQSTVSALSQSVIVELNAGQYIDIRSLASYAYYGNASRNDIVGPSTIEIVRVGN